MVHPINRTAASWTWQLLQEHRTNKWMHPLRDHHLDTYRHSVRVGLYAMDIGLENDLPSSRVLEVGSGGLLHDIGKLDVPVTTLNNHHALSPEELAVVRGHPRSGFELLSDDIEIVRYMVVAHHEWKVHTYPRNGNGHGNGVIHERRSFSNLAEMMSQIVAAADIFDALAHARSYKIGR